MAKPRHKIRAQRKRVHPAAVHVRVMLAPSQSERMQHPPGYEFALDFSCSLGACSLAHLPALISTQNPHVFLFLHLGTERILGFRDDEPKGVTHVRHAAARIW